MSTESNTPAVAAPAASLPTSATATPATTPFAKANPSQVKGGKPFGNKKAKFVAPSPKS